MEQNVLTRMEQMSGEFSKGQKRIAEFLTEHYEEGAYMTAARLGAKVGVSESTVVRFASELGYPGYPELQAALHELLKNKLTSVQRMRVGNAQFEPSRVLQRVLHRDMECIRHTMEELDANVFCQAAQAICSSRQIYIVGMRSAAGLAQFMRFYLGHLFPNVQLINTAGRSEIFERLMYVGKEDVVLAITFPRYSKRTVQAATFAKNNGATVVALTDSKNAPIAQAATFLLAACSDMQSYVDSLVAPLSVLNALLVAVGLQRQGELASNYDRLERIWSEYDVYQTGGTDEQER